jgi:hypothetical protein
MHKQFGNWKHALMAYNGGPGAVSDYLRAGNWSGNDKGVRPKENIDYVNSIMGSSAGLTPEQRQKAAAAYQTVQLNIDSQAIIRGEISLPDFKEVVLKQISEGKISAENGAQRIKSAEAADALMTDKNSQERNKAVDASYRNLAGIHDSGDGKAFTEAINEDQNLTFTQKRDLLNLAANRSQKWLDRNQKEPLNAYMTAYRAIYSGAIENYGDLFKFPGVSQYLSLRTMQKLMGILDSKNNPGAYDAVEDGVKTFKASLPGTEIQKAPFVDQLKRVALDNLAAAGIDSRSEEARAEMDRLTVRLKDGTYAYQNEGRARKYLFMDLALHNQIEMTDEIVRNIFTYHGLEDTAINRERLADARRLMNDPDPLVPLDFNMAWPMSRSKAAYAWAGQGAPTLNLGYHVNQYDKGVRETGNSLGIDPNLLKALIYVSSRGNQNYRGIDGRIGLLPLYRDGEMTESASGYFAHHPRPACRLRKHRQHRPEFLLRT